MKRLDIHTVMMKVAHCFAQRSTCIRRSVGAVISTQANQVLSAGYNGVSSGLPHCIDRPCDGASFNSGRGLDICEAIHAEINAIIQCNDIDSAYNIYCTTAPCVGCIKALINTPIRNVYYAEGYAQQSQSERLWLKSSPDRRFLCLQISGDGV